MPPDDPRSPSPHEEGFHSTEQLLPGQPQVQRSVPWQKVYRAASADDKADLVVVGLLAGMLLAGVLIGAAFLPRGSDNPQMEALKAKYKVPSVYTMPTTPSITTDAPTTSPTTNKNAVKIKARHPDRRDDEQPETKDEEVDDQTNDAEETTTPRVEEQEESDSEKESKVHRQRKTTKSRRPAKRRATTSA